MSRCVGSSRSFSFATVNRFRITDSIVSLWRCDPVPMSSQAGVLISCEPTCAHNLPKVCRNSFRRESGMSLASASRSLVPPPMPKVLIALFLIAFSRALGGLAMKGIPRSNGSPASVVRPKVSSMDAMTPPFAMTCLRSSPVVMSMMGDSDCEANGISRRMPVR